MFFDVQQSVSLDNAARSVVSLTEIIEAMPDAVVIVDSTRHILWMNGLAEELLGYSRAELIGRCISTCVRMDVGMHVIQADHGQAPSAPAKTTAHEARIHRKEGGVVSVEVFVKPFSLGNDPVELHTLRPAISRHFETSLQCSSQQVKMLMAIAEEIDEAVLITDSDFAQSEAQIQFANRALAEVLGYSPAEVVGKTTNILRTENLAPAVRQRFRAQLAQGLTTHGEVALKHRNGSDVRVHLSVRPIVDEGGKSTHFVSILRDMTDEHSRTRFIAETQEFLRATLEAISAQMAVLSPSGHILAVNEAWMKFAREHGSPQANFLGTNYFSACEPGSAHERREDAEHARQGLEAVIAGRADRFYMEYPCTSPTSERWFSMQSSPFDEAPPRRILVAHVDITERKIAERRLRRQLEWQRLLSEFSNRFMDLPTDGGETVISDALDAVATFVGADRAYLLLLEQDGVTLRQVYGFTQPHLPEHQWFYVNQWRESIRAGIFAPTKFASYVAMVVGHLRPDQSFYVPSVEALDEQSIERQLLGGRGLQSMLAVPMVEANRVTGFLGLDTIQKERKWSEDDMTVLQSAVELFTTALSRWRAEEFLRTIIEGVSVLADTSFLNVLVERICRGLEVDYAFIAEIVDEGVARTLAFVGPDGIIENATLLLAGTPAVEIVERGAQWIYRKDVQATFPDDKMLARLSVESYVGVPLCDTNGRILGFMAVMHTRPLGPMKLIVDIMRAFAARAASEIDRRRKDETLLALNHALELRVAERAAVVERQAAAMDATTEGMAIMEGEIYVYMNDAHAQMYGYESGRSLLGHSWRELFSEEECARIDREVRPVLVTEGKFRGQFVGKRRNGVMFDVHLALNLNAGGDIICCCEDITEEKRIQSELAAHRDELRIANIELSRAVQLKDEFLASMSHELRTPLNAILGMTEILLEEMVGGLNDKQRSFLRIVDESGKHLLSLINDILDLSKIEAGKLALEYSMVDVRMVCEASLRLVRPAAEAKKTQIKLQLPIQPGTNSCRRTAPQANVGQFAR